MAVTLADIRSAATAIQDAVTDTPCLHSRTLSEVTGAEVHLKFENLQFTAAFKERGALNKLPVADAPAARGRRDSRVGGQSCARGGLPCTPTRDPGRYRDAALHADG